MDRTIIFCQRLNDCANVFAFFKCYLGPNFLISQTVCDHTKYRLVDMYTSCNKSHVKKEMLDAFTSPESPLRYVIATIAFGLGVNCLNVRRIIHLGPTEDIENYVQQVGRAGGDGDPSHATLLFRLLNSQCWSTVTTKRLVEEICCIMTLMVTAKEKLRAFVSVVIYVCLLYTSPSPRDATLSRMPSSA